MPYFKDTSGKIYASLGEEFDMEHFPVGTVEISDAEAAVALNLPSDLDAAKSQQIYGKGRMAIPNLAAFYREAVSAPVSYTSVGGVTKTYQADPVSISNLQYSITGCEAISKLSTPPAAPSTPPDFCWVSLDNTQVPFTYADLNGLAAAIFTQGAAAFQRLQAKKATVRAAATVAEVESITW